MIKLEHNYRSTQMILDAANSVICKNRDRHEKALWTDKAGGDLIEVYQAGDERGEAYIEGAFARTLAALAATLALYAVYDRLVGVDKMRLG